MVKINGTDKQLLDRYVWAMCIGKNHAFKKYLKKEISEMWKTLNLEQRVALVDRMNEVVNQTEKNIKDFKKNHIKEISEKEFQKDPKKYLNFVMEPPNQVVVKNEKGETVLFLQMDKVSGQTEEEKKVAQEEMAKILDAMIPEQKDENNKDSEQERVS